MAPMHFTENDKGGFKVPFAWGHDSCQIIINNLTPHAEATFPIVLIAHLAAEIAEACIVQTPANLGGDIKIGDHDQFEVILAGTGVRNGRLDVVDGNSETMPCRKVIEDSDEEENNLNSLIRSPKPVPEESPVLILNEIDNPSQASVQVSAGQSTASTAAEVLNRDIQDAYSHLLEPSTSRSSRSSHISSGSPLASKRRVTSDFERGSVRKTKITYGAKKSRDDSHLGAWSEDEEPVRMRKRARIHRDVEQDHDEAGEKDEDQSSGSTFHNGTARHDGSTQPSSGDRGAAPDASMPPPASRTPVRSRQLVQSSNGSTIPYTERASFPPSVADGILSIPTGEYSGSRSELLSVRSLEKKASSTSKARKRAVSDLESPRIILGEELPPSSSAPTESPTKRARIDSARQRDTIPKSRSGSGEGHDELPLPAKGSPRSKRKQARPRESEPKTTFARACLVDELGSDDLVSNLPKEIYQPRPSRSRSALTADELVIPEDYSIRPEALAKSKRTSKRRKTTAFEETSQAVEPAAMQQQDSGLQALDEYSLASTSEPVKEPSPQLPPQRKKSRGRPKKDAAPQEQTPAPSITEIPSGEKGSDLELASPVKQVDPAPAPAKRGRKRKKTVVKGDDDPAHDILPGSRTQPNDKYTETVLAESDPNIQPSPMHKDESSTMQEDIKQTASSKSKQTKQPSDRSLNDSSSPVKLKVEEQEGTPKTNSSAKQESKTIYRVGLSKRQRIPSLLRVVRK
ncbi:MAG: hypothetical protein LQ343_002301 [Gyalolechia ehrenbergii]|nr:MAG: hypothetical protein LQ343_002301 [Gyalolechia ehrenbergii]